MFIRILTKKYPKFTPISVNCHPCESKNLLMLEVIVVPKSKSNDVIVIMSMNEYNSLMNINFTTHGREDLTYWIETDNQTAINKIL